jgi:RimJ/RimL family protein N-acetyltransferase
VHRYVARPLGTARLLLRTFTLDDVDDALAYQSRPDVLRYTLSEPRDRAGAEESVRQMTTETVLAGDGDSLAFAVVFGGTVIGQVDLVVLSVEHRQGEVGYIFHPDYHGRGLATEATGELLRLGFEELGLHRIVAVCNARNAASARLMERLGMRREAHFLGSRKVKGEFRDEYVYAILRDEWAAGRSR